MGNAPLPKFRKLYGKIAGGLNVGTYSVTINSSYDVHSFSAQKRVVLTTHSALGGKSNFLGIIACIIGSTSIIGSFIFFSNHTLKKKKVSN